MKPSIRVHGKESDGTCRIFVEDNGAGFDEKYLDKIFKPFQILHGKEEFPGTGIGLAVCRKIVERHGGSITAKSTVGKGSIYRDPASGPILEGVIDRRRKFIGMRGQPFQGARITGC